jgi:hypothetical protein
MGLIYRFCNLDAPWKGQNDAAGRRGYCRVSATPTEGGKFDKDFGVLYQVNPGGGNYAEIEIISQLTLTEDKFEVVWAHGCGGQHHRFWIKFQDANVGDATGEAEGPKKFKIAIVSLNTDDLWL